MKPTDTTKSFMVIAAVSAIICFGLSGSISAQKVDIEDQQNILEWSKAEEKTLAMSGLFYNDLIYDDYVSEIGNKVLKHVPGREKINFRFHTIRNPFLNAFAMATGAIYVHTGLVARLENEAQLAAVIAHEINHAVEQHPVLGYSHSKSQLAGYQFLSIGASVAIALVGGRGTGAYIGDQFAQMGLVLMTSASMSSYSREMEQESDIHGLQWIVAAGYNPNEVPKVFALFLREYGDQGKMENYFWGDHPRNETRMKYLNAEIQKKLTARAIPPQFTGDDVYKKRTNTLLKEDARLNIQESMFHTALAELDTFILRNPLDPEAVYFKGFALHSMTKNPDTLAMGKELLNKSIAMDPTFAKPHRALAAIAEKDTVQAEAIAHYEAYLELEPKAKDRLFIKWKIDQLQGSMSKPGIKKEGGVE